MPKIESSGSTNTTKINHKTGEVSKTSVQVNTSKEVRSSKSYDEKYTWSSFLNIPTFMVLFFMIVLGSAVFHFVENKDVFVPRADTNQLGALTYMNDVPMHELNGLTLNEVFDYNNLHKNDIYNPISPHTLNYDLPYIELIKKNTSINGFGMSSAENINTQTEKYYYFNGRLKGNVLKNVYIDTIIIDGNSIDLGKLTNEYKTYSIVFQNQRANNNYFYIGSRNYAENDILYIKDDYILLDLDIMGISPTTDLDYYYDLYQEQIGVQFEDFYYYISMEDYEALGNKAFMGFTVLFNEGGIIDTLLDWTAIVQDTLLRLGNTLTKLYEFLSFRIDEDFDIHGQLDRYGMEYEDIPRTKLEVIYRSLPKWMQPDTWFD